MAVVLDDKGTILGWHLVALDEDNARRLYFLAEQRGLNVEQLIDDAIREKADRMEAE